MKKTIFILGLFALTLVACNKDNQKVTETNDTVVVLQDSVLGDTLVGVEEDTIVLK